MAGLVLVMALIATTGTTTIVAASDTVPDRSEAPNRRSLDGDPEPEPDPSRAGVITEFGDDTGEPVTPAAPEPSWTEVTLETLDPPPIPVPEPPGPIDVEVMPLAGGDGELTSNEPGCASDCIVSALITPDPKFAAFTFDLETNVATTSALWVTTDQPEVTPPTVAVSGWPDFFNFDASTTWSAEVDSLQYDTTYWVVLYVLDQYGNERWAITEHHTVDAPGADNYAADGSPCYFGCIKRGVVYPGDEYSTVHIVLEADIVMADYSVAVSQQPPVTGVGDPLLPADEPFVEEQGGVGSRTVRGQVDDLAADTTYHVLASVTDDDGFTQYAVGSFHTEPLPPPPPTDVFVSFDRVEVLYDGDPGDVNRGEIAFMWGFEYGPLKGESTNILPTTEQGFFGHTEEQKLVDGDSVDLGSGRWISVEHDADLPWLLMNAREDDKSLALGSVACESMFWLYYEVTYLPSCKMRITTAMFPALTLDEIESLPTCDQFGYPDELSDRRCAEIYSAVPNDNYATFKAWVSFDID